MAIYKSLNGLINQSFVPGQSEATETWHFGALSRYSKDPMWLLGSGIGKSGYIWVCVECLELLLKHFRFDKTQDTAFPAPFPFFPTSHNY